LLRYKFFGFIVKKIYPNRIVSYYVPHPPGEHPAARAITAAIKAARIILFNIQNTSSPDIMFLSIMANPY